MSGTVHGNAQIRLESEARSLRNRKQTRIREHDRSTESKNRRLAGATKTDDRKTRRENVT